MISKTKYKESLRWFWIREWKYERTPEEWAALIDKPYIAGAKDLRLIQKALDKLEREKKIDNAQKNRLWEMIKSPDQENVVVAITVMATLRPKKFKKILT